jgi:hypothetical protein
MMVLAGADGPTHSGSSRHNLASRPWPCEHLFVTAQGSALTRYRRALERRHIFGAEMSATEMGYVGLRDALARLALYAAADSPKYEKAAIR